MAPLELLKKEIHQLLIAHDGDLRLSEHRHLLDQAKELGMNEQQLSRLLQEMDGQINWDFIREQRKALRPDTPPKKEAVKKRALPAPEETPLADVLVLFSGLTSIRAAHEIKAFFSAAGRLNQDENAAAKLLEKYLYNNGYTPSQLPKGHQLKYQIQSTDWVKTKNKTMLDLITPGRFLLVVIVCFVLLLLFRPSRAEKEKTTLYSWTENAVIRSSADSIPDNIIRHLSYGEEVEVTDTTGNGWLDCRIGSTKGYIPLQFLWNKRQYTELNSIFPDEFTRQLVPDAWCRQALLDYFSQHHLMGKLGSAAQKEIYGTEQHHNIWQVAVTPAGSRYHTVNFSTAGTYRSFACLIEQVATGQRKFLLFSLQENGDPVLLNEQPAPDQGFIREIIPARKRSRATYTVAYISG